MPSSDLAMNFQTSCNNNHIPTHFPPTAAKADNTLPSETNAEGKYIHQVIGVLLYYGRVVNSTIFVGLSSLAAAQSKPTAHTLSLVKWLLDYAATNPDAIMTYEKSNMVLAIHSNASYLSKCLALSQVGGHFSAQQTLMTLLTTVPYSPSRPNISTGKINCFY
jgi:hypothetical protein